ncbi:MAG: flagellar basal body P-ring protein FlgI [Limnochordaceae bacterium]|nr:flagellar basal body P-ring protein FlgI [Limnochordaceae bacterium]
MRLAGREKGCGLLWGAALGMLLAGAAFAPVEAQEAGAPVPEGTPAVQAQAVQAPMVRVGDLVRVEGLRPNQLVGMGLVVGLDGTGDGRTSAVHVQMFANMLRNFGLNIDPALLRPRNVAAVMVTALLPPLARPGDRLDVTVSSMGDARSLAGGVLLQTPLTGADGEVYAVAQGNLILGGSTARSLTRERVHPTVGSIPSGAIVERAVDATVAQEGAIRLVLYDPDFVTAARVVQAINQALGSPSAFTSDGAVVTVRLPRAYQNDPAALLARIEELTITPAIPARVVINERTGTVVLGHQVRIAPVAVAHGAVRVQVGAQPTPAAWPGDLQQPESHVALLSGATIGELVDALNAAAVAPKDLIAILEAMQAAGALYARLEVQ